ncbi:Hypothetical Protein FCC1311_032542 [Hondaea fermentalgiana]|uniref:Uncharacterized protein n=1 Tax=Hondaea fermentalgiana TaxID=2315210 RepID=A0A2R5GFK8_9STRA|nr:Hypothetical Protein FCC1311_032542 [Hondaea fermentalgiana]|eukprot:GBG27031.1 Hypothetical Protein FCC1311_032542 [Hondaea fermentalgiana]
MADVEEKAYEIEDDFDDDFDDESIDLEGPVNSEDVVAAADSREKEREHETTQVMKSPKSPPQIKAAPPVAKKAPTTRKTPKWLALEELERDRSRVSLNRDRVRSITQKLSKLQQGLEVDRSRSRAAMETQVKELQTQIQRIESEQESRLEECDQQIEHVMEALGQERLARELLDERKTKEAEAIIKSVDLKIDGFRTDAVASEEAHASELREIREQMETEKILRAQAEEKFGVQLYEQVARLTEQVESYKDQNTALAARVQTLETASKAAAEEAAAERRAREDHETHVDGLLEDLCLKMRNEILAERNDRESMEETLLKLIEETCARVEGGLVASSSS